MFLKHPAWAWLKKNDKSKLPEVDENTQAIFDAGHKFEEFAEQLMPDGVRLGFDGFDEYEDLTQRTQDALSEGATVLFQGRFEAKIENEDLPANSSITCITDVVHVVGDKQIELYEIKSSTRAKADHNKDLAFQKIVLQEAGYEVVACSVMHVNRWYSKKGDLDPHDFVGITDVTRQVDDIVEQTRLNIFQAFQVVNEKDMPDPSPRFAKSGGFQYWLEIYKDLFPKLGKYSIYKYGFLGAAKVGMLEDENVKTFDKIPDTVALTKKQRLLVDAIKAKKPIVEVDKIKEFISSWEYPIYFLDYETMGGLIPAFDGLRPYQQVPFQYSLHYIEKEGGKLKHKEYLHTDNTNPGEYVAECLKRDLVPTGSIVVWYQDFEKGVNTNVGKMWPEYADFMAGVNNRIVDLMVPFSNGWYVHPDSFGSASIKYVLPALVPELSYKDLNVGDGQAAQRIWMQTVLDGKNSGDEEQIFKDLIEYCTQDTLAMVKIWEILKEL